MLDEMLGNVRPNEERLSEGQRRHTAINLLSTNNLASIMMVLNFVRHRLHAGHGSFIISGGHNIGEVNIEPDAESLASTSHKHEADLARSV